MDTLFREASSLLKIFKRHDRIVHIPLEDHLLTNLYIFGSFLKESILTNDMSNRAKGLAGFNLHELDLINYLFLRKVCSSFVL